MKRKEKTRAAGRADALLFAAVVLLAAMADIPVPVMAEGQETAADAGILMDYSGHSEGGLGDGMEGSVYSVSYGDGSGEAGVPWNGGLLSVSGGNVLGGSETSSGQDGGTFSVSGGNASDDSEISDGQEAGTSFVSGGDASGGSEILDGQEVSTSSVSGGDASSGEMLDTYSMALVDADYSGTVYGIEWAVADGVLTLTGTAEGSPSTDELTDDNYTEVWPWLAHASEYSSVVADCVMPGNCTRFFSGIKVSEFVTGAGFDAGDVRYADNMFRGAAVPVLDISSWEPEGLYSIYGMFYGTEIGTLSMSGWDFSHLQNYTYMMDRDMGNVNSSMMFLGASVKNLDWSYTDWTGQYTIPSIDGRAAGADTVSHVETVDLSHVTAPQAYHFMTGYTNLWHYKIGRAHV